jgi:hypothetical protein
MKDVRYPVISFTIYKLNQEPIMFDYITEDPNCDWLQVHSVMFLNIQFYSSGTRPWNRQFGDQKLGMTEHAIKQFHVMRILNAA